MNFPKSSFRSGANLNQSSISLCASRSHQGSTISLNSTAISTASNYIIGLWEDKLSHFEDQLMVGKYLQLCLIDQIIQDEVMEQELMFDEKLSELIDTATDLQVEESALQTELSSIELQEQLDTTCIELRHHVESTLSIMCLQANQRITTLLHLLQKASDKLYLINVIPLKDQGQFDALESVLLNCSIEFSQFLCSAGKIGALGELKTSVLELENNILKLNKCCPTIEHMNDQIGKLVLKTLSDELVDWTIR